MAVNDHIENIEMTDGEEGVPKFALALIAILVVSIVAMIMIMRGKPTVTKEVVVGQELVIGVEDATLYVSKDAIIKAGAITISPLAPNLYSDGDASEWVRPQVVSVEYLDLDGNPYSDVVFPKPVLICFKISKRQWQHYAENPDEYQVQYYDDEDQDPPVWVELPMSTYPERYQLCGQTDHLSIFALAVKPQAMIAITGGGTSTATPTGSIFPTFSNTLNQIIITGTPTAGNGSVPTPVSTQAALTATSVALTATSTPLPTNVPTDVPTSTHVPTSIPTATDIPEPTATNVPPPTSTDVPEPTATDPPQPTETDPPDPTNEPDPTEPPTEPPTDPTAES